MGLFDKLKSLVSDDKKDTGTIEIVAPLSGEIVNIEDVPDVVLRKNCGRWDCHQTDRQQNGRAGRRYHW